MRHLLAEKTHPAVTFGVLEDQVGLGVRDGCVAGEKREDELAQFVGVSRDDVQEEVIGARHVKNAHYTGKFGSDAPKRLDLCARVLHQPNGDECLHGGAEDAGVKHNTESADRSTRVKTSHPKGDRRLSDTQRGGEGGTGCAGVERERAKKRTISVVEIENLHRGAPSRSENRRIQRLAI